MKYILYVIVIVISLPVSFSSELSEYENHYKNMNRLKGELEQLELKKKIQEVENKIYEDKLFLKETKTTKESQERIIKKIDRNNGFDPKKIKLLYIIGIGNKIQAVLSYSGKSETLNNGDRYHGWKVKVLQKEVALMKGSEVIKL